MKPYYDQAGITIYHGDCLALLQELRPRSYNVRVTDPPYGIGYSTNHGVNGVKASWSGSVIAGDGDTTVRDAALQASGEHKPALVFGSWKVPPPKGTATCLVWDKGPASGMGDLSIPWKLSFELVYVLGAGFVGSRDEGVLRGHTVVTWESRGRAHPNEKPVSLMKALLAKCPREWVVLDPFCGSGSTLRAAKDLGMRAIGIELEERYCEVAAARMAQEVLDLSV